MNVTRQGGSPASEAVIHGPRPGSVSWVRLCILLRNDKGEKDPLPPPTLGGRWGKTCFCRQKPEEPRETEIIDEGTQDGKPSAPVPRQRPSPAPPPPHPESLLYPRFPPGMNCWPVPSGRVGALQWQSHEKKKSSPASSPRICVTRSQPTHSGSEDEGSTSSETAPRTGRIPRSDKGRSYAGSMTSGWHYQWTRLIHHIKT